MKIKKYKKLPNNGFEINLKHKKQYLALNNIIYILIKINYKYLKNFITINR